MRWNASAIGPWKNPWCATGSDTAGLAVIEAAVAAAHADGQAVSATDGEAKFRGQAASATDGEAQFRGGPAVNRDPSFTATGSAPTDAMLDSFLAHYAAHIADASRPYPGVVDTLQALSARQAKLAVVTNKRIELTRKLLAALNLTGWFDIIVGGDTTPNPKPAADPIHFACRAIGLKAKEILFVGDSLTDVNASRAAGCPVVCVPEGYNHGIPPEELGADAIIGSLLDLV